MKGVSCIVFVALLLSYVTAQELSCDDGVEFIPHPTDCNLYYSCSLGQPVLAICPPELWWNPTTNLCDYPDQAGCTAGGSTISTTEQATTDTDSTTVGTGPTSTGSSTLPTEEPTTETGTSSTSSTTTNEPSTEPPGGLPGSCPAVDDPLKTVRLPHATSCDFYYICKQGSPVLYTCGAGNHFSPTLRVCRPYNAAGCDRCPDVDVVGEEARLPHETDCHRYYLCINTVPTLYQCRVDWHFSRNVRDCLTIEEAKCTL